MTISLIVPVYRGGKEFYQALESISSSSPKADEVIIVADGDNDESYQLAQKLGFQVIRLPQRKGPAYARNQGAKQAQGDILFFVDADVQIYPDTITKVQSFFQENPDFVALIGSYDLAPGSSNFLSQYKNLFHHYTHQNACEEASTFWGACGAIKKEIFWEAGGFDHNYQHPCIEDIELGYRLKEKGYRIKLCKNIQVKHLKRWGIVSLIKADFFYRAMPWMALILSKRYIVNDLNLNWTNRASVILVYFMMINSLVAYWWSDAYWLMEMSAIAILVLNRQVYHFFYQQRGLCFTLKVIPWHWLYLWYCGLAFLLGWLRFYYSQLKNAQSIKES